MHTSMDVYNMFVAGLLMLQIFWEFYCYHEFKVGFPGVQIYWKCYATHGKFKIYWFIYMCDRKLCFYCILLTWMASYFQFASVAYIEITLPVHFFTPGKRE